MRQKLKHAQSLIEGLAVEDFGMIRDNARALRKVAQDAQWRVSPNLMYVKYSAEFADIADELERRATEKDLDGATLSYVRLTINCVDCHKYVRFVTRDAKDPGGAALGRLGPIPEGLLIFLVGIGALIVVTLWIGARA